MIGFAVNKGPACADTLIPEIVFAKIRIHLVCNFTRCHSFVADTCFAIGSSANVAGGSRTKACIGGVAVGNSAAVVVTYNAAYSTFGTCECHAVRNTVFNCAVVNTYNAAENTVGNRDGAVCRSTARNGSALEHSTRDQTEVKSIFSAIGIACAFAVKVVILAVGDRKIFYDRAGLQGSKQTDNSIAFNQHIFREEGDRVALTVEDALVTDRGIGY